MHTLIQFLFKKLYSNDSHDEILNSFKTVITAIHKLRALEPEKTKIYDDLCKTMSLEEATHLGHLTLDSVNTDNETLLTKSIRKGYWQIAALLLNNGASVDPINKRSNPSCLSAVWACINALRRQFYYLWDAHANIDQPYTGGDFFALFKEIIDRSEFNKETPQDYFHSTFSIFSLLLISYKNIDRRDLIIEGFFSIILAFLNQGAQFENPQSWEYNAEHRSRAFHLIVDLCMKGTQQYSNSFALIVYRLIQQHPLNQFETSQQEKIKPYVDKIKSYLPFLNEYRLAPLHTECNIPTDLIECILEYVSEEDLISQIAPKANKDKPVELKTQYHYPFFSFAEQQHQKRLQEDAARLATSKRKLTDSGEAGSDDEEDQDESSLHRDKRQMIGLGPSYA